MADHIPRQTNSSNGSKREQETDPKTGEVQHQAEPQRLQEFSLLAQAECQDPGFHQPDDGFSNRQGQENGTVADVTDDYP